MKLKNPQRYEDFRNIKRVESELSELKFSVFGLQIKKPGFFV
ncbi:hypothetical protein IAD21_06223 [Abditibacteriota bacterium]|nr:hypothetical protein IAD21_06223 [Abditibacteriota bacterium]